MILPSDEYNDDYKKCIVHRHFKIDPSASCFTHIILSGVSACKGDSQFSTATGAITRMDWEILRENSGWVSSLSNKKNRNNVVAPRYCVYGLSDNILDKLISHIL